MSGIDHVYELELLVEIAKKHNLYVEVKNLSNERIPSYISPGQYLLVGGDEKRVKRVASEMSDSVIFPDAWLMQDGSSDLFLHCSIIKYQPDFVGMIRAISTILDVELMVTLFKKYGRKLPAIMNRSDFQILYRAYKRSQEPRGEVSQADLEYYLEIVESDKTMEEYEKIHGKNNARFGNWFTKRELKYADKLAGKIASKKVVYKPKSANYVSKEHILDLPYEKAKVSVSHGDQGETIRRVDEALGRYPNIKWTLAEETTITPYGKDGYQYWHTLTYPKKYEAQVCGIVNLIEFGLDTDESGHNIAKAYIKGTMPGIVGYSIPNELFNAFAIVAAKDGIEYYYDEYSTYVSQTNNTIGICVETESEQMAVECIFRAMIYSLGNDSHLSAN